MLISNELAWSAPENAVEIDLTHETDLRYWTQTLSCSSHELVNAVQAVGISVADLAAYLKRVNTRLNCVNSPKLVKPRSTWAKSR